MVVENDSYLEGLLHEITQLVQKQPERSVLPSKLSPTEEFQSPIKGSYYNSGDYSPNTATDPRHPQGHKGVDLRAAGGTSIYSIAPGIVTSVGTDPKGGNVITISHSNDVKTYYAHLGTVSVHKGDKIDKNTVLGTIGNSGNANGTFPHLHIQVWKNNQLQNPSNFFHVPAYSKVDMTKEKVWLSPDAKMQASTFDMKKYKNMMSSKMANDLLLMAEKYYKMAI